MRSVVAAVLAILAASAAAPAAALADGTVTVSITGTGTVKGSGIDCSATNGSERGDCSAPVVRRCVESPPLKPICFPAVALLTATPGSGFELDGWAGCTVTNSRCSVPVNGTTRVTAVFKDIAPPSVSLTAPAAGTYRGTITLKASASDNARVQRVVFTAGGDVVATDSSPPYAATFDSREVADGLLSVKATARDATHSSSHARTITIDNTPPSLTVTGPDGQTFGPGSTQRWAITAADANGVASVRCRVTPNAFGACSGGATGHTVSGLPLGTHTFEVRATDKAGNTRSVSRRFTISAPPAPPAPAPAILPAPAKVATVPPAAAPSSSPRRAPAARQIFVTLAFRYRSNRRTTRLTRLVVKHVPKGAKVKARCKRGCARKRYTKRHAHGTVSLKRIVRRKRLKVGTRITVTVSKRGRSSMIKQLRIRKRKSPSVRTRCRPPGAKHARRC